MSEGSDLPSPQNAPRARRFPALTGSNRNEATQGTRYHPVHPRNPLHLPPLVLNLPDAILWGLAACQPDLNQEPKSNSSAWTSCNKGNQKCIYISGFPKVSQNVQWSTGSSPFQHNPFHLLLRRDTCRLSQQHWTCLRPWSPIQTETLGGSDR